MRTILSIIDGVLVCGCAGARDGQSNGSPSHAAPVVIEPPSASLSYNRQHLAEQAAETEVQAALRQ
jgi:hypothetical protein